jgi:pimeloyl-ACP methyl ester carboxylesterase
MRPAKRQRLRLLGGTELSFIVAGDAGQPAVLLLHGSPSSARMFRDVIPDLSQVAHVIAPDLRAARPALDRAALHLSP